MVLWPGLLRRGVLALARPHILTPKLLSFMSMDGGGPGMGSLQKEPSSAHLAPSALPQGGGGDPAEGWENKLPPGRWGRGGGGPVRLKGRP